MSYRVRNIGIAVTLALVAALLTTFYVSNYRRHIQRQQAATPVLVAVARHPRPARAGTAIAAGHFVAVQNIVEKNRVPGAFTSPEQRRASSRPSRSSRASRSRHAASAPSSRPASAAS